VAVHFTVPGPPTAWQRPAAFLQRGKIVQANPKGMAEKQEAIAWACRAAMRGCPPMTGPLRLEVLCVYAPPVSWPSWKRDAALAGAVWKASKPDHDNLEKQIGDALNGVAYADDAQIVRSSCAKRYGQPERTEVRLTRVDGLSEHASREQFMEWQLANGTKAAAQAAGAWLAALRGQPSLPGLDVKACNTNLKKGPGGA
jgi:Holliday junction resolvase RusA-like endonuclease